jgi:NADH-quinone oxidoreductase subunit C
MESTASSAPASSTLSHDATLGKLRERFGADALPVSQFRADCRVTCPRDQAGDLLAFLRRDCGFDLLVDITAVDYLEYRGSRDRFAVVYSLTATQTGERLIVKVFLNEPDLVLPSVVPIWNGANWMEREVFDMFGIRFDGHPDLRRILMPDEFTAYPLRKDYPLRGRGERHNFPVLKRGEH